MRCKVASRRALDAARMGANAYSIAREMCTAKGVAYPAAHWAKQLLGQVASNEKTDGKFETLPKDESAYGAFIMDDFE